MTERMTLAQLNALTRSKKNTRTTNPQAERRRDHNLGIMIKQLERLQGLKDQGRWPRQRDKYTVDLLPNGIVAEYPFARLSGSKRRYRFDLAIPKMKIALEVNGGAFVTKSDGSMGGAHHSLEGRARDMAKGNLAAVQGWIVIEVSPNEVANGVAYNWLVEALEYRRDANGAMGESHPE